MSRENTEQSDSDDVYSVTMTALAGRNALDALNRAHVLMVAAEDRGEGGRCGYQDSMAWVRWLEARIRRGCCL
jgi:hypothetical protein